MKSASILVVLALLSGCANMDWVKHDKRKGYEDYDPCIRCGEKWYQLPNPPFDAQLRRERGEHW